MDLYQLNKNKISQYIIDGEKPIETMGAEIEHIVVEKDNFKSVPYEGGVESILKELLNKGWQRVGDKPLLHLEKSGDNITLEPGAQLELSVKSSKNIREIEDRYFNFVEDILPIVENKNYYLLSIGYRPLEKAEDIHFIPKMRYEYMSRYLNEKGKYALNMMKGSAALQVTIDYRDQDDYIKKNRVANFLSPAISYLFDNSPIFEGSIYTGNTARVDIWNNTDDQRSKLISGVLDRKFGYDDYSEYILESPCIIALLNGEFVYTGERLVRDIYREIELENDQIEHLISMFFPDVRTKNFIEIRMSDTVPYPYNMAALALWKGILYNKTILEYYYQESLQYDNQSIQYVKEKIISDDKKVIKAVEEFVDDLLSRLRNTLVGEDRQYIEPLLELYEKDTNLSKKIKKELKDGIDLRDALKGSIVNKRLS